MPSTAHHPILVVGIGADGWTGLAPKSALALQEADIVIGSARQLTLVSDRVKLTECWPSPMAPAVADLRDRHRGRRIAVLASGDPMYYGVGVTLVRAFGPEAVHILPHPSSVSLACARLGWAQAEVTVVSAVGRALSAAVPALLPGSRTLILVSDSEGASDVAGLLLARGMSHSPVHVLEQLGGPAEKVTTASPHQWLGQSHDPLSIVGVEGVLDHRATARPTTFGLPDEAWETDGVLTKREVRAITLAMLGPLPGQLLWDVGAGSGSVAIEWMRSHPRCRAVAIESRSDRLAHIAANAETLGVPDLTIVAGQAPTAFTGLPTPDAIFIGGGLTTPGLVEGCVEELRAGGCLVANGVTLESELVLAQWHKRLGGELRRIAISHVVPIGAFSGFRPTLPITQWTWRKPVS